MRRSVLKKAVYYDRPVGELPDFSIREGVPREIRDLRQGFNNAAAAIRESRTRLTRAYVHSWVPLRRLWTPGMLTPRAIAGGSASIPTPSPRQWSFSRRRWKPSAQGTCCTIWARSVSPTSCCRNRDGYTIRQGLRVGGSAYSGPYLDREYPFYFSGKAPSVGLAAPERGELQRFEMELPPTPEVRSLRHRLWLRASVRSWITAHSETVLRMPARRRATLLPSAPRAQRDELDAARIASDIAAYRSVSTSA